jgi:tripartite-type tricarboxylate transporter receptor subunit TctC
MASAGTGTVGHVGGEMFAKRAGIKVMHVPYKGAGPATTDLLGGVTDMYFATPPSVISLIKSGKLRAVAVTSPRRLEVLPDVPTVAESGYPGFEAEDWKAMVAPAGTPPQVIAQINKAVNAALARPEIVSRLRDEGSVARGGTPAELGAFLKNEQARWGTAVRESGAKLD